MVVTKAGTEITLQAVLRMEEEYLVLRGRLQGTSNAGHIFFVPFEQIDHISTIVEIKEQEVEAIFGSPGAVFTAGDAGKAPAETPDDQAAEVAADASAEEQEEGEDQSKPDRHPTPARGIHSIELLERIRARTGGKGKK
jgi:hypothetical protein